MLSILYASTCAEDLFALAQVSTSWAAVKRDCNQVDMWHNLLANRFEIWRNIQARFCQHDWPPAHPQVSMPDVYRQHERLLRPNALECHHSLLRWPFHACRKLDGAVGKMSTSALGSISNHFYALFVFTIELFVEDAESEDGCEGTVVASWCGGLSNVLQRQQVEEAASAESPEVAEELEKRDATRRELIAGLRAAELKDLCIELGVEHTGRKAELYERVCERARKLSLSPAATSDVVCSRSCKLEVTDTALWERLWGSDTSNGGLRPRETVAMTEDEHLSHIEAEDAWRRLRMRVYVTSACSLYSAKLLDCPMVTPPPGLELQYARCRSNSGQTLWLLCSLVLRSVPRVTQRAHRLRMGRVCARHDRRGPAHLAAAVLAARAVGRDAWRAAGRPDSLARQTPSGGGRVRQPAE